MHNTVLVTGAHGFIGRHVARYYANKGWIVTGIGCGNWTTDEWRYWGLTSWLETEINLNSLMDCAQKPDLIIHCAGSAMVGVSLTEPYVDFNSNVTTTLDVLEYIRVYSPHTRLVYPSSAAVYGTVETLPISENSVLNPVSPYGFHKKIAEELCLSYAKNYSIPISIVRLFSVYGAGLRKQLFWDACLKAHSGIYEFFGTGNETRDFICVKDVAELLYFAGKNVSPEVLIINGGSGIQVKVKDLIAQLFVELKCNKDPVFNLIQRIGDPMHYQADITKATLLGWFPKVSFDQGINNYVNWFEETTQ